MSFGSPPCRLPPLRRRRRGPSAAAVCSPSRPPSRRRRLRFILLLCLALVAGAPPSLPPAAALTFALPAGGRRCFTQALPPATRVYGEVFVTAAHGAMAVDVAVTDVGSGARMWGRGGVDHAKFGFTSPPAGSEGVRGDVPRVVDGRDAVAARAARAAHAAPGAVLEGGGAGGGTGDGGGDDPWGDDIGLEDEDWETVGGGGGGAPPAGGGGADDAPWATTRYEVCVSGGRGGTTGGSGGAAAGVSRRVRLTLSTGAEALDWGRLARREHLGRLEVALRETDAALTALAARVEVVKAREELLAQANAATAAAALTAGVVGVGVLLGVGVAQGWLVRRHLRKKKVL